jgi:hypothetical protein
MTSYGRQVIGVVGRDVQLIASEFEDVIWKPGGITIDWTAAGIPTGTAVTGTTLTGGTVVPPGARYIPMGTILMEDTGTLKYRPALTADGGALLRGKVYLVNTDILELPPLGIMSGAAPAHPGVFNAGTIWKARLRVGGTNVTSAQFEAAFPMINYAEPATNPGQTFP